MMGGEFMSYYLFLFSKINKGLTTMFMVIMLATDKQSLTFFVQQNKVNMIHTTIMSK